jgi:hypothetical protein
VAVPIEESHGANQDDNGDPGQDPHGDKDGGGDMQRYTSVLCDTLVALDERERNVRDPTQADKVRWLD